MKISKTAITIVTEAEWHDYEILRDLPAYMRFGFEIPPSTSLPPVLVDRLYRQWWAAIYFESLIAQNIKSFVNKNLNKNPEVHRKTARRGQLAAAARSDSDPKPTEPAPERRQSFAKLFGPKKSEVPGNDGPPIWKFSQQTFTRLGALFQSIFIDEHSSDIISSAQLRTIDTRTIAALCAYGEPISDVADVMSLVDAIIIYAPEHARDLLCDKFLPEFQSTCIIKLINGSLVNPMQLERLRPAGAH